MSKQDNTNLFRVLERGDRTIQTAHDTAVMLVGLTRAGKSTTFNWILGQPMLGKGDQVDAYYETIVNDAKTAELGNTFTSVTLCPNIVELDKEHKLTLIDMAGYKDKRNYIGVLGVSYFLKAVFERVRKVKFVIVIDQQKLMESSGQGVINTFTGFLNMFNLKDMPQDQRSAFYASISMVVTRSERGPKHQGSLRRTRDLIQDQKLLVDNKPEFVRLLNQLIECNRIQPFPIAIPNDNPPKCDFFPRFQRLGWDYLDVSTVENQMGTDLITVPFISDFTGLLPDQQTLFNTVIQSRVNSYTHFARIIDTLIKGVSSGWLSALANWKVTGELSLNLNECDAVFSEVMSYLDENDFYNSEDLILREIRPEYKPLNFVRKIKQILQIFQVGDIINSQQDHKFIQSMNFYTKQFGELIGLLVPFASNGDEEHLLNRLSFIVKRGFRDFSKLYQLNDRIINDVNRKMKDYLNDVFLHRRKFIELFVTQIDGTLLPLIFPKLEQLLEYEDFFNDYQNEFYSQQDPIFFSRHRYDIQMTKANLYLANYQKSKALHCYNRAFRYQCEIAYSVSHSYDQQEEAEAELNQIHMKKLGLVGNIIGILKDLNDIPEACDFALLLAKYVKNIHESCEIYQLLITRANSTTKLELISDFVEYCLDWGRLEQANVLLQRKLSLEKSNFEAYMATIVKITDLAKNRNTLTDRYLENLTGWTRLAEDDPVINGHLGDLEVLIPDL